jgi:serine protease Do
VDGSSAQKAGLQEGDIITRIGDKAITSPEDLRKAIGSLKPGDNAECSYLRKGIKKTQKIVLGKTQGQIGFRTDSLLGEARPFGNFNFQMPQSPRSFRYDRPDNPPRLGMKIEDTEEGNGVKIMEVEQGSAAEKAGLKKDDIITGINGEKVKDVYDLRSRIQNSADRNEYKITAKRNNHDTDFEVHIPKVLKSIHI